MYAFLVSLILAKLLADYSLKEYTMLQNYVTHVNGKLPRHVMTWTGHFTLRLS
jgi:hypothetical protein